MNHESLHLKSDKAEFYLWIENCPATAELAPDGTPHKAGRYDWLLVRVKAGLKTSEDFWFFVEFKAHAFTLEDGYTLAHWLEQLGSAKPASDAFSVVGAPCDMMLFDDQFLMFAAWLAADGKIRLQVNLWHDLLRHFTPNPAALTIDSPPQVAPEGEPQHWAMALNLDLERSQFLAAASALRAQLELIPQVTYGGEDTQQGETTHHDDPQDPQPPPQLVA